LRLLRHGERAGNRVFDLVVRIGPQELQIPDFDWMLPANLADDSRHRIRMTAAVERSPGMINVHSFEGGGKTVRITFASDLTVGDDVEARAFLIPDRQGCV